MSRRRRRLLSLCVLLAGAAVLLLPPATRRILEGRLSAFFQRPVRIGAVRFLVLPFAVEIAELSVAGMTPEAPPFLAVARVEVVPSLTSLVSPRVSLARVRVQGLSLRINAFPQGGNDIPKLASGRRGSSELRIHRLTIEASEFLLNHARVPLDLDLPEFQVRLQARRSGALAGRFSFGRSQLRFSDAPPFAVAAELDLLLEGRLLSVESGRLRTDKTELACTGQIRLQKDPLGEFHVQGPVDLEELDRKVWRTGFGIQGDARFDGLVTVDGPRIRIKGDFTGSNGVFDGVPVPRFAGWVAKDELGVHLKSLETETLGGAARFEIEIPPGKSIARLDAQVRDVDLEGALMAIFDIGAAGIGSAGTGQISIRWPKGRMRLLSGAIALDLKPRPDGRTPLEGRYEWSAEDGVEWIEKAELKTPTTRARLRGRIEVDDRTDMTLDGESGDLAASDDLLMRVRRALGTADARRTGFSGSGAFRGRWKGTLQAPVFEGRFVGQDVGYLGVVWGRAEWVGRSTPTDVESHSLVVRRDKGELWLDGRIESGLYGEADGVEVRARFRSWPAEDFIKAFAWELDATGLVTGEADVSGRRSAPAGSAHLTAVEGRYYGIPYQDLELSTRLRGDVTELTAGRARVGGGLVTFRGTATDDDVYDGSVEAKEVEIGEVVPPPLPGVFWGGRVSGELAFHGTFARPRLKGRLSSPRLFLADEGLGAVSAELEGRGDGNLSLISLCRSGRVDLVLSGNLGAEPPHVAALELTARGTSLDPFLRVALPDLSPQLALVATGEAALQGPLATPRELAAHVSVASLELLLPEYPVRNRGPIRLTLADGRLAVQGFHLAGEGTDLVLAGGADLLGEGPVSLTVRGEADLRTLTAVTRRLRGRGAAHLAMDVAGTRRAPRVEGTLALDGAGLRVRGFPHGLEDVRGTVRFTEAGASFDAITATVGGGALELGGQAAYHEGRLGSFDVQANGSGLALRYPEGLRSLLDAELRFYGDSVRQWVAGTIDVRQAVWTRRYDVASELLAGTAPFEEQSSLSEALHYDVKIRAPGTLRIDNNLATLQARAELTLTGTYEAPVVLGRAEIDRGRVYFQGNTYEIRRGSLDFANPRRIDPFFEIEAETRLRSYRITLRASGTLERVYPTLSSDPPLSAVQILNLLAGADETTVATLTPTQTDQARLAATGAATLAAGKISEEVGLERGAERLFGLNRFSIDPSVVKGGVTNPTARLTVGKRITPDLNVLYSVDLRGSQEYVLSVEYTLSNRFSLLLTRSEPGGLGFDVRLRQSR